MKTAGTVTLHRHIVLTVLLLLALFITVGCRAWWRARVRATPEPTVTPAPSQPPEVPPTPQATETPLPQPTEVPPTKPQVASMLDTVGKGVKHIKTLASAGGRVDWSAANNLIAFDRRGEDGYYDVWVMKLDGSGPTCLTCTHPQSPKHNGNPTWHPSGEYIAFQSQDPDLKMLPFRLKLVADMVASPGGAINNNLWMMTADGREFWQLTHVRDGMAVLHPHFSHDGSKLVWAEKAELNPKGSPRPDAWGEWVIKIADFDVENEPTISNIRELKPGDLQFYETHGFFPGDNRIIFSAFKRDAALGSLDIFVYDLVSGELQNLTNTPQEWDEHAQVLPDGSRIVWVSSMGIEQNRNRAGDIRMSDFKLDFWIMDADGSNKQRLTYFNEPGAPEYIAAGIVSADSTLSPDGKMVVAKIRIASKDPLKDEMIVQIELP